MKKKTTPTWVDEENARMLFAEREREEMRHLLAARGYSADFAVQLQNEGMGSFELEYTLNTFAPGEVGSLDYTHNMKRT